MDIDKRFKKLHGVLELVETCREVIDHSHGDSDETFTYPITDYLLSQDQIIKELEEKIKELKNVIGGEYVGYYCAEHGAINGVEVTCHERCAICGRDANHQPKEQD